MARWNANSYSKIGKNVDVIGIKRGKDPIKGQVPMPTSKKVKYNIGGQ